MQPGSRRRVLALECLETRLTPASVPWLRESFDTLAAGSRPAGWTQYVNGTAVGSGFGVSGDRSLSPSQSLAVTSNWSRGDARVFVDAEAPADLRVSAAVTPTTLIPALVLARGRNLDTPAPTYYAVQVTRGVDVRLIRMVDGVSTTLAGVRSTTWLASGWLRASLDLEGDRLRVEVFRPDTGKYLNAAGGWQDQQVWLFDQTDAAVAGPGRVGLARLPSYTGTVYFDDLAVDVPLPPGVNEPFDTTPPGALPAGWSAWTSLAGSGFAAAASGALSPPNGLLSSTSRSDVTHRTWVTAEQPADLQAGAAVYLNSLIPARVLVRGRGLDTPAPTYYAAAVVRGLKLDLLRVENGVATTLATLTSQSYLNNLWVRMTLSANGTTIRAQLFRPDTAQYLNGQGRWQTEPAWALAVNDDVLTGPGLAGLERTARYAGALTFDDFTALPGIGDNQAPTAAITAPAAGATLTGVTAVTATAADNVAVTKVEFYVDGVLRQAVTAAPYRWDFDTVTAANGAHTIRVAAYDAAGNVGLASIAVTTQNDLALSQPTIPQHYSHIRLFQLAYGGTPFGPFEEQLLRDSIDVVLPYTGYLNYLDGVAPATPKLLYTNVSNVYQSLLLNWLAYADANGFAREDAFYHAATPVAFTGNSPSSQPVSWFWAAARTRGANWLVYTDKAHGPSNDGVALADIGESFYLGYPERFREINVQLLAPAANGWSAVLEYPNQVDAQGNVLAWGSLPLTADTTNGWQSGGTLTFDPPADWKPAVLPTFSRLYYVRVRTTQAGTAPVAWKLLGRDYVNANGTTSGTVPVFDTSADANLDGYLSDAEYAGRAAGKDARFAYEGRLFHAAYGQMRFSTNPANLNFRAWAVAYHVNLLNSLPQAAGLYIDNSNGMIQVPIDKVAEPTGAYLGDYASLLGAVARAVSPKWLLANTSGNGTAADQVVRNVQGYYEEFAIRAMEHHFQQFEALAATVARRLALRSPAPFAVLDSLARGGSPTDPRTQVATLAYYYLLADPQATFLNLFGGSEPASSWTRHWTPAAAYDVGQPQGSWTQFATGADPANAALTYRVYQRSYTNALVLYKPLSFGSNVTGTLADATATTHLLDAPYRPLQADGTLGAPVTSVTLRNGEGAILIR